MLFQRTVKYNFYLFFNGGLNLELHLVGGYVSFWFGLDIICLPIAFVVGLEKAYFLLFASYCLRIYL